MKVVGQGGVRAHFANGVVMLTPDEIVLAAVSDEPPSVQNPFKDAYFYAYQGSDGLSVWLNPGLLVFDSLAYSGLGIDVSGPLGAPFTVTGLTPSTSGFIYYEAEVEEIQGIGTSGVLSNLVHIGATDYNFELTSNVLESAPGAGFTEGTMIYSASRPSSSPGYYRKTICMLSVDSDGRPFRIRQEHMGALFISDALITSFPSWSAGSP